MEDLLNVLKVILPSIITGIFTFIITKYTYNKNKPLEKLEVAYNRVYYPLYRIISDKKINNDIHIVIEKSKIYFEKYHKYIDQSTKIVFDDLCQCDDKCKKKTIYQNFKSNIYDKSLYLRRRLGYLEPNFLQMYKYYTPSTKSLLRILTEICIIYLSVIFASVVNEFEDKIYVNCLMYIFIFFCIVIITEIVWCFLRFIYYKIRKLLIEKMDDE